MPEPGESLSVSHAVVGTQAGEVVSERMQLVLLGILKLALLAEHLHPLEKLPGVD